MPELDPGELIGLSDAVVGRADPGEELEVYAAWGRSTTVRAYEGEVEAFTSAESFGVGIRVIRDHRQGFAHATVRELPLLQDVLEEARDNARYSEPDDHHLLARPDGRAAADLDLWHDHLAATPEREKIDLALELERQVRSADPRVRSVRQASYGDSMGEAAVCSTAGIRSWSRGTYCYLSASALATQGEETQVGAAADTGRVPEALDLERVGADAAARATRLLGATKPKSKRLSIVLEPRLSAALLGVLGGTLTGQAVQRGRSPFADRMGDTIASPMLSIVDDPTDERSIGAGLFDGEGLACRRNVLIENGVLAGFLHDASTASRAGTASTASAVRGYRSTPSAGVQAIAVRPGAGDIEGLVSHIPNGLLVTSLAGLHSGVNPVSGDFAVGADGIRIRGGELAEPVREITLASTLQRMLLDIEAVGADVEWLPSGTGGVTLVIRDTAMSGQ